MVSVPNVKLSLGGPVSLSLASLFAKLSLVYCLIVFLFQPESAVCLVRNLTVSVRPSFFGRANNS